jgi:hypothetical protein
MALQKLDAWITANPNYRSYPGTISGAPLIVQAYTGDKPTLTATAWSVCDIASEVPQIEQAATTVDVSTTGAIAHKAIAGVPDLADSQSIPIWYTTDDDITAAEDFITLVKDGLAATGGKVVVSFFRGVGVKSQVWAIGGASASDIAGGSFAEGWAGSLSVTPSLGTYQSWDIITGA